MRFTAQAIRRKGWIVDSKIKNQHHSNVKTALQQVEKKKPSRVSCGMKIDSVKGGVVGKNYHPKSVSTSPHFFSSIKIKGKI